MNSIIYTNMTFPELGTSGREAVLDRLSAHIDVESRSSNAHAGRRQAVGALNMLAQLYRNFALDPKLLLFRKRLGTAGANSFDTYLRWSEAQVEDILATLRHGLNI